MATVTGHDGTITISGEGLTNEAILNLRNFTIEQTQDTIEDTAMGSSGMRTYKPGLSTFTISGDVFFDASNAGHAKLDDLVSQEGEPTLMTFEAFPSANAATNGKFAGAAIMTSFSVTSSVDGMVEASFAAQGSGALTMTTVS